MCYYRTDDGKCRKFTDDKYTSYCVEGPCPDDTPTNAQRIRGMSDEELAEFLWEQNGSNRYWKSVDKYVDWLQQPAETEGTE
jgi:hypothetical protein